MKMNKPLAAILSTTLTLSMLSVSALAAERKPLMEDAANRWAADSIPTAGCSRASCRAMQTASSSRTAR